MCRIFSKKKDHGIMGVHENPNPGWVAMVKNKSTVSLSEVKALLLQEPDFLKELVS